MDPQIRTAVLINYGEVARSFGLDPARMLRSAGIDPAAIQDSELMMPAAKGIQLLEDSARLSGCTSFGLLLAETRTLESIGAVGLLLKHQPTVGDAVRSLIAYQRLIANAVLIRLDENGGEAIISADVIADRQSVQGVEFVLGMLCRILTALSEGVWQPAAAHFVHVRPDDVRVHQRMFRCPLFFGDTFYGLTCSAADLTTPNPKADAVMALHARRYLDILLAQRADLSAADQSALALHKLLPGGRGTLEHVARSLQMSPRSLQRALEQEGTSFSDVLNGVRSDRAIRYLADERHSVTDVAALTGYANLSSFTRWFSQAFGVSPAGWRAGGRGGGASGRG